MISIARGSPPPIVIDIINSVTDNFMATADENSKKKFLTEVESINKALTE